MKNPEHQPIAQENLVPEKPRDVMSAQNDQNDDLEKITRDTEEIINLESTIKKDFQQLNELRNYFGFESIINIPSIAQSKERLFLLKKQNEAYGGELSSHDAEIKAKQKIEKNQRELLEDTVKKVQRLHIGLAEKYLPEESFLQKRIVDYYSDTERLGQELSVVFKDMDEKDIQNQINKAEQLFQNKTLFIEYYQKIFERSDAMKQNKRRGEKNPIATDEEYEAGTYREGLEIQVRDAVFAFMKKGYSSFESGFREKDADRDQYIGFYNKKVNLPKGVINYFRNKGFEITVINDYDRTVINIHPLSDQAVVLEEWKKIWDELAEKMPPADTENFDQTEIHKQHFDFRKNQDSLRK